MDAEQIVRALAAMEAPIEVNWPCNCLLCRESDYAPDPERQALDSHEVGCLWRLAREWVTASAYSGRTLPVGQDTRGCEAVRQLFGGKCPDHDPIEDPADELE